MGQRAPMIMILAPKIIRKVQVVSQALVLTSYEEGVAEGHPGTARVFQQTTTMFKSAAAKIAHSSTLPSIGGNKDLRPLQDLIIAEKSVLVS